MSDLINEPGNKKKGLGRGLGSLLGGSEGMASASNNGSGVSAFGALNSAPSQAPKVEVNTTKVTNTQVVTTQNNQSKAQVVLAEQVAAKQATSVVTTAASATSAPAKTMTNGQVPSQSSVQAPASAVATQKASIPAASPTAPAPSTTMASTAATSAAVAAPPTSATSPSSSAPTSLATSNTPVASTASAAPATSTAPATPAVLTEGRVWQVAIDKLSSGEYQPRQHFEKEALNELAQSIRANGILQPIVARKLPNGRMEIIAGERRWRAAQLAGLHEVPVLLKAFDDRQALEMAIVENVQREDLNPIEEAEGYSRLITEFNLSQQAVAEKVGKERATVANAVRLLQLPILVREMVAKSELSSGHAKVLLGLSDPNKMLELARRVLAEKIPVRKLEKLIAEENEAKEAKPLDSKQEMANRMVEGMAEDLQKLLGTKVSLDYRQGKGKVSIQFYSDDELTDLVEKLKAACQK